MLSFKKIAGSSNGRTSASGAEYLGSNPSLATREFKTKAIALVLKLFLLFKTWITKIIFLRN